MNPNPNKETPEQELENLAITPCSRCFQCDFKRNGECMNPYKECSICAIIRQLAKDFATHYKAREAELLEELNQVCIYKSFDIHATILNKLGKDSKP